MILNSPKVLIVEDDYNLQNMYRFKLEIEGFTVQIASNGEEGLYIIKEFMPDLVLLDLHMPIMSGDEMLARLREHEWAGAIRVIILTNLSKNEAPQSLRFLNVDRYIIKAHSTPAQVVDVAREVLNITHQRAR